MEMKLDIQIIGPDHKIYTAKVNGRWITNKSGLACHFKSRANAMSAAFVWCAVNEVGLYTMLKALQNEIPK